MYSLLLMQNAITWQDRWLRNTPTCNAVWDCGTPKQNELRAVCEFTHIRFCGNQVNRLGQVSDKNKKH